MLDQILTQRIEPGKRRTKTLHPEPSRFGISNSARSTHVSFVATALRAISTMRVSSVVSERSAFTRVLVRGEHAARSAKNRMKSDVRMERPNDPSLATRPTRASDCNLDAMAGFAAAHG